MRRISRGFWMVLASVITTMALVTAVAIATGAIPGSDGVIHACYEAGNGSLRVVTDASECRRNEVSLQWNQTGPRGPAGPSGARGDTGATGPAGIVANFDALAGLPCNLDGDRGTIQVTYGPPPAEEVTLICLTPPGPPDHLTCAFQPTMIIADGASIATATVKVRDARGQKVETGSYSVTFDLRSSTVPGGTSTLITANPQLTVNGSATFVIRSIVTNGGVDTYAPTITPGSQPTLPNTVPNGTCAIAVVTSFP